MVPEEFDDLGPLSDKAGGSNMGLIPNLQSVLHMQKANLGRRTAQGDRPQGHPGRAGMRGRDGQTVTIRIPISLGVCITPMAIPYA
jgi:hypothetical protein